MAILAEDGSKYDLGIECDGFTYHSTPAARDRDWLRQQVLEGLGWNLHRVWSTGWIRNPDAELNRIEAALTLARSGVFSTTRTNSIENESANALADDDSVSVEPAPPAFQEICLEEYQPADLSFFKSSRDLKEEITGNLVNIVIHIANVEGPVHKDIIIERVRQLYRLGRVKGSTREKVEQAIRSALLSKRVKGIGSFIWHTEEQLHRTLRYPASGNIEHIPPTEIRAITLAVAKVTFGIPRNDLITEIARVLKFNRTGDRITEVLDTAIGELLAGGQLDESFGMIRTKNIETK